jgi:hypothetical protein
MYYIHSIASITHQDSFRKDNVYESLTPITEESELITPNYKDFIPPAALRRLSPVLRIGLTAAIECKNEVQKEFDAIIVGTALGCLKDTEKFLTTILTTTSSVLSPTAFIQSTHNTIGGQISLGLKNHAYNMTHTQNSLSFEVSLLDAIMCIEEGKKNVLVGAADEKIDFLKTVQPGLMPNDYPLSSGGSFFSLSKEKNNSGIAIKALYSSFNPKEIDIEIKSFLKGEGLELKEIDLILHSNSRKITETEDIQCLDYLKYTGVHYSASAFAVHIAHDYLKTENKKYSIVVNDMCKGCLGLILVARYEA